jgi:hypothetical protein
MPDDEPGKQAPGAPADPFGPMHVGCVAVLEMFRGYRRAGGGMVESAVLVAALIRVNAEAGPQNGTPGD